MFITGAPEALTAEAPTVAPAPVPVADPELVPAPELEPALDPVLEAALAADPRPVPAPAPQPVSARLAVPRVIKAMAIERKEFTMKVPVSICGYVLRAVAAEVRSLGQEVRNGPVMRDLDTEGGGLV
jgi:hypothetical protein